MYNDYDEIIPNLYLGNLLIANDIKLLKEKGFKKILTIMDNEGPKYEEKDFIHKKINIEDYSGENIIQYFGDCLNFMNDKEKILVHCMAGASRSATIVIAYIMWNKKMKFNNALNLVKSKRAVVNPNRGFKEQLKIFDKLLYFKNYNIDKINFKEIKWEPKEDILFDL